jgi:hypothetical protein
MWLYDFDEVFQDADACPPSCWEGSHLPAGRDNQDKEFKHKKLLEFTRFFGHRLTFLGPVPCVSKGKGESGKNGKSEEKTKGKISDRMTAGRSAGSVNSVVRLFVKNLDNLRKSAS